MLRSIDIGNTPVTASFQENVAVSVGSFSSDVPDIEVTISNIQAEIERRNTLGYGLGIFVGRAIGTRTEEDQVVAINSNKPSLFSSLGNYLYAGLSSIKKLKNNFMIPFTGYSELHIAILTEDLNALQALVSMPHNINSTDAYGNTPAYYAVLGGNLDALEMLIDAGVSIESLCTPNQSLLDVAIEEKNDDVSCFLMSRMADIHNALSIILKHEDVTSLKFLLQNKHDPSIILARIINENKFELLEELLKVSDIDLNAISIDGLTLLEYAIDKNHFEIATMLINYGVNEAKRPIIAIATSSDRNGPMYRAALETIKMLGTEVMGITITPPLDIISVDREIELLSELNALQSQLGSNNSFPQAMLNSGIEEVEKIKRHVENMFKHVDGILLSGGLNVWRDWYTNTNTCEGPEDLARDIFEIAILDRQQREQTTPLIGICRGNQMINVFHGGSLKDEGELLFKPLSPVTSKGILGILAPTISLGWSNHKQSIDKLAPNLEAVMIAKGGMIKAIQAKNDSLMLMGTQFHPEAPVSNTETRISSTEKRDLRQGGKMILFHFAEAAKSEKQKTCLATHEIETSTVLITKILSLIESIDENDKKALFEMFEDVEIQNTIKGRHTIVLETALRSNDLDTVNKVIEIPGILDAIKASPDFIDKMLKTDVYIPVSIRSKFRF